MKHIIALSLVLGLLLLGNSSIIEDKLYTSTENKIISNQDVDYITWLNDIYPQEKNKNYRIPSQATANFRDGELIINKLLVQGTLNIVVENADKVLNVRTLIVEKSGKLNLKVIKGAKANLKIFIHGKENLISGSLEIEDNGIISSFENKDNFRL